MIFKYSAEEIKRLEDISSYYEKRIAEKKAEIKKLRDEKDVPKEPERPKDLSDDKWEEWNEKIKENFDEWEEKGSPEWKKARRELLELQMQEVETRRLIAYEIERKHFDKLKKNRDKIIKSAEEQVNLLIENRFNNYQKIIETKADTDGRRISGFSARDLRVDGNNNIWLDAPTIVNDCKESLLFLHYETLREKDDQEAIKALDDLVLKIVSESPKTSSDEGTLGAVIEFKKPKKPRSKKELPTYAEDIAQDFFYFATTPAKDSVYNLLSSNGDVNKTALMMNAVSKKQKAKIYEGENSKAIQVETDKSQTIIELLGSACQEITSRPAKKILHFIESEMYQKTFFSLTGSINDHVVTFPLQKLVDKNLYTSAQNARRAFYDASNFLTALRVSATLKSGKHEFSLSEGNARMVLFPTMLVEDGQCYVRLNSDINWSPFLKDFFLMPDSWWALPDNASDLEYEIFRKMRMEKNSIKDGKLTFKMSLKSVAMWLNLPLNTKNPKRNVKDKIEEAVKQITESLDSKHFKIEIKTDFNASLTQYLEGYLVITADGIYTQNLINLNEKQQKRIEYNTRRKEKIVNEASIRRLTEDMKNDVKIAD